MFCKNCGKQIDDDSSFCPNCGLATGKSSNTNTQTTQYTQNEPVVKAERNLKETKKKDSILSVVAAVFALLGWISYALFAYIGLIIAIVDLALAPKENPKCRHLGSYFAIVIVIIVICFTFVQLA